MPYLQFTPCKVAQRIQLLAVMQQSWRRHRLMLERRSNHLAGRVPSAAEQPTNQPTNRQLSVNQQPTMDWFAFDPPSPTPPNSFPEVPVAPTPAMPFDSSHNARLSWHSTMKCGNAAYFRPWWAIAIECRYCSASSCGDTYTHTRAITEISIDTHTQATSGNRLRKPGSFDAHVPTIVRCTNTPLEHKQASTHTHTHTHTTHQVVDVQHPRRPH